MQILVRTHHPEAAQLRETVERRVRFAFRRLNALVPRADIKLDDINGPRGGADKRCQIQIPLPRHNGVVIEETDADLYVAIDRAASRAGNTLARQLARRHRQTSGRSSVSLKHLLAADDNAQDQ